MWVAVTLIPFALLIFACAEADLDGRRTVLRNPVLIRLGQWSFAFYLVHQLVTRTTEKIANIQQSTAWHAAVLVGSYLASIVAAYLVFRFVEHPFERRIRHGGTATPPEELGRGRRHPGSRGPVSGPSGKSARFVVGLAVRSLPEQFHRGRLRRHR
jgi:peptidoglycan/LPS O-acetylase OafA/YrhL